MDIDEILLDTEDRMEKAVQVFQGQLHGIRTGRATPGLVDSIRVDYYGSQTPIKQMANVTVQEGKQIVIRPYDATATSTPTPLRRKKPAPKTSAIRPKSRSRS
jgi:ribosome recycling factor